MGMNIVSHLHQQKLLPGITTEKKWDHVKKNAVPEWEVQKSDTQNHNSHTQTDTQNHNSHT